MARVASYQVLRDTSQAPNLTTPTAWGTFPSGYSYSFFIPQGLITNRNRARPILECYCTNRGRPEALLMFRIDGVEIIRVTLKRNQSVQLREVFDWNSLPTQPLATGSSLPVTVAMAQPASNVRLSDIVLWYQIDTNQA